MSLEERTLIKTQLSMGFRTARIAREPGCSTATLSRELKRNGWVCLKSNRNPGWSLVVGIHRFAWPSLLVAILTGCATITITDQSGTTRVERHFGLISIELGPTTTAVVAEAKSLGYLGGPMGISLGAGQSRIAALPQDCHLVLWLERPDHVENLKQLFGDRKDLCVINRKGKEQKP